MTPDKPRHPAGMLRTGMIACRHCDMLQRTVPLTRHTTAVCARCGSSLYRGERTTLNAMLALALASAVLLIVSNLFPIADLSAQGIQSSTTLWGTGVALYDQGRALVGAMVLVTTILVPSLEIALLLYLLLPLRAGIVAPGLRAAFRMLIAIHPWGMMEVFMLGIAVTLVKLADLATVVPGIAMWSYVALIGTFTAITASFSTQAFWSWVEQAGTGRMSSAVAEAA